MGHWTVWTFLLLVWHKIDRILSKAAASRRIKREKMNAEKGFVVFDVTIPSPPTSVLWLNGRGLR